ncbi:MAG: peptidase BlaR1 [Capsulimonas sp.]|nr:peptidase BlaR1 [Capsulimonas sp.]
MGSGSMAIIHSAPLLIDLLLKSAIVLAIAFAVALCLTRASAAVRHLVWASAFAVLVIMPIFTVMLPPKEVEGWPQTAAVALPAAPISSPDPMTFAPTVSGSAAEPAPGISLPGGAPVMGIPAPAVRPAPSYSNRVYSKGVSLSAVLASLWLAGVLLGMIRLMRGLFELRKFARYSREITDPDIDAQARAMGRRPVIVLRGGAVTLGLSPMTWGVFRPIVLLPLGADNWTDERRRSVLAHEFAHVARCDWLVQTAATCVAVLYWPNPLVWWALRSLTHQSERACDDRVLVSGVAPAQYAGDLLEIIRSLRGRQTPGAVPMARPKRIENRVQSILKNGVNRTPTSAHIAATILIVSLTAAVRLAPIQASRHVLGAGQAVGNGGHEISAEMKAQFLKMDRLFREQMRDGGRAQLKAQYQTYLAAKRPTVPERQSPSEQAQLAHMLTQHGMYSQASRVLNDLLKKYPDCPEAALASMDQATIKYGYDSAPPAAIEAILARYDNAADEASIWNSLGKSYEAKHDARAIRAYRRAYDLSDDNVSSGAGLSCIRLLAAAGRIAERDALVADLLYEHSQSSEAQELRTAQHPTLGPPIPGVDTPADWKVSGTGGVTVELVRVATSQNGSWLPDGRLLSASSQNAGFQPGPNRMGVVLRITGPRDPDGGDPILMEGAQYFQSNGSWEHAGPNPGETWYGQDALLNLPDRFNFCFNLCSGPWSQGVVFSAPAPGEKVLKAGGCMLELANPAPFAKGGRKWIVTDNLGDMQSVERRLIVVDRSGRRTLLKANPEAGTNVGAVVSFDAPKLPIDQVREFRLEKRPCHRAEFRNIHLMPNARGAV